MVHEVLGKLHRGRLIHLVEILKKKLVYWIEFHLLLLQEAHPL